MPEEKTVSLKEFMEWEIETFGPKCPYCDSNIFDKGDICCSNMNAILRIDNMLIKPNWKVSGL